MYFEFLFFKKKAIEKSWDLNLYEYNLLNFFQKIFCFKKLNCLLKWVLFN